MALYRIWNAPAPTTASIVPVTTGTGIKTMLQVKPGATQVMKIKEWGWNADAIAAAVPGIIELCVTDVAATVTAHIAAGIHKKDSAALASGDPTTSLFAVGTTSTGYTASGEGTVGAVRMFDGVQLPSTGPWVIQQPLGCEWIVNPGEFMRIRCKLGAAVNALCYVDVEV